MSSLWVLTVAHRHPSNLHLRCLEYSGQIQGIFNGCVLGGGSFLIFCLFALGIPAAKNTLLSSIRLRDYRWMRGWKWGFWNAVWTAMAASDKSFSFFFFKSEAQEQAWQSKRASWGLMAQITRTKCKGCTEYLLQYKDYVFVCAKLTGVHWGRSSPKKIFSASGALIWYDRLVSPRHVQFTLNVVSVSLRFTQSDRPAL